MWDPLLNPASRTFWMWWISFGGVALVFTGRDFFTAVLRPLWSRSTLVDLQLLVSGQLLGMLGLRVGGTLGVAAAVLQALGESPGWQVHPGVLTAGYTLALFVCWDLSRYAVHRCMHGVSALWVFHRVHHTATELTPLTFHRVHPVESAIYGLRGVVVTGTLAGAFYWAFQGAAVEWTLLGVHGVGLVLNAASGNLRHSHVRLGFGPLEGWLISPRQHQLHHTPAGERRNYGTWIALWDRLGGTLTCEGPSEPHGTAGGTHEDLLSAWFQPLRALFRRA